MKDNSILFQSVNHQTKYNQGVLGNYEIVRESKAGPGINFNYNY